MTALLTIAMMQVPKWEGRIRDKIEFQRLDWVIVLIAAQLGMNFNDHRYPGLKPSPDDAA